MTSEVIFPYFWKLIPLIMFLIKTMWELQNLYLSLRLMLIHLKKCPCPIIYLTWRYF